MVILRRESGYKRVNLQEVTHCSVVGCEHYFNRRGSLARATRPLTGVSFNIEAWLTIGQSHLQRHLSQLPQPDYPSATNPLHINLVGLDSYHLTLS